MTDTLTKDKREANPGSDEAIAAGCACPVIDNGHGRGYMGQPDVFVYTVGCPLHGAALLSAKLQNAKEPAE